MGLHHCFSLSDHAPIYLRLYLLYSWWDRTKKSFLGIIFLRNICVEGMGWSRTRYFKRECLNVGQAQRPMVIQGFYLMESWEPIYS